MLQTVGLADAGKAESINSYTRALKQLSLPASVAYPSLEALPRLAQA